MGSRCFFGRLRSQGLGKLDKLVIAGFDGNTANLVAIKEGEPLAMIKHNNTRIGAESVQNISKCGRPAGGDAQSHMTEPNMKAMI